MRRIIVVCSLVVALIGSLGIGRAGLGTAAQDATPEELAAHPVVGTWLAMSPSGPTVITFGPDGSAELGWAISYVDPTFPDLDVVFNSPGIGTWEPVDARKAHFTVVAVLSDMHGTYLGTATLDGYPTVGTDGQTFTDVAPEGRLTVRDAANHVLADLTNLAVGVTATRMTPGSVVFPAASPAAATPTS